MKAIEIKKMGGKYYLFQESELDPRGNRYMGPFDNSQEMEIFALRVLLRAKKWAAREAEKAGKEEAGEES